METRTGLRELLINVLNKYGVWVWDTFNFDTGITTEAARFEAGRHVFEQPPENVKLSYPCIIYERSNIQSTYADNFAYKKNLRYTVTVIDFEPNSPLSFEVADLPLCRHDQHFVVDNLHHDTFTIYI